MRLPLIAAVFILTLDAQAQTLHLIPTPRELKPAATLPLTAGLQINCADPCDPEDAFAIADLKAALAERNIPVSAAAGVPHILVVRMNKAIGKAIYLQTVPNSGTPDHSAAPIPPAFLPEGYAIIPDGNGPHDGGLALTANTAAGIFYGLQTIKQLLLGNGPTATLQTATIRDWPALPIRGLHDDLSRGPVDTLDFQKKLIRTLAAYKVNLYSPYFETTQQYASNPLAAPPGGSLSADDARQLVAYARPYHITVVPEQEAFGHLRHELVWEQYAPLAETPHGAVLAPGQPGSLALISQQFTELAQLYPSPFLHIGADETADLGLGQTKPDVDARGLGPVYLDFLQRIVTTLQPLHRKILFWGDVAQDSPTLLKAMPQSFKDQTIAIAWGYLPNPPGGFPRIIRPYTDAGIELWVAPSINNYRQVWPNQQLALEDIQQFTRDGQRLGATGQLNTLWHDDGESLINMDWYGILFGAAAAWQQGESSIPQFQSSFGEVFHGDTSGQANGNGLIDQAQNELTAAMSLLHDTKVISATEGTDTLFWIDPWSHDGLAFANLMRPIAAPLRLHAERAITLLAQAKAANPNLREPDALAAMDFGARRIDFLGLKFQLADEMAASYARAQTTAAGDWKHAHPGVSALLSDINGVNGRLQDLTYGYSHLRDMYQQQWLLSYRPANLQPVLERYDFTVALWLSRIDKVRSAQRQWTATHTLPSATDANIPPPAN
jgi:hypothetical protein